MDAQDFFSSFDAAALAKFGLSTSVSNLVGSDGELCDFVQHDDVGTSLKEERGPKHLKRFRRQHRKRRRPTSDGQTNAQHICRESKFVPATLVLDYQHLPVYSLRKLWKRLCSHEESDKSEQNYYSHEEVLETLNTAIRIEPSPQTVPLSVVLESERAGGPHPIGYDDGTSTTGIDGMKAFQKAEIKPENSKEFDAKQESKQVLSETSASFNNVCDSALLMRLRKAKYAITPLWLENRFLYRLARAKANPFEALGGAHFQNRAALKLAELDAFFNPPLSSPSNLLPEENGVLFFADLCAGPGGFTEYLYWRHKWRCKGFGFTLKCDDCDFRTDLFNSQISAQSFETLYGKSGDGDIFREENILDFTEKVLAATGGRGVALVTADGGFTTDGDWERQEFLTKRLILCQFLMACCLLREGGNFMCKMFDTMHDFTLDLIFVMCHLFDSVCFTKPLQSRPANGERFIVCRGYRRKAKENQEGRRNRTEDLEHLNAEDDINLADEDTVIAFLFELNRKLDSLGIGGPDSKAHLDVAGFLPPGMRCEQFMTSMRDFVQRVSQRQAEVLEAIPVIYASLQQRGRRRKRWQEDGEDDVEEDERTFRARQKHNRQVLLEKWNIPSARSDAEEGFGQCRGVESLASTASLSSPGLQGNMTLESEQAEVAICPDQVKTLSHLLKLLNESVAVMEEESHQSAVELDDEMLILSAVGGVTTLSMLKLHSTTEDNSNREMPSTTAGDVRATAQEAVVVLVGGRNYTVQKMGSAEKTALPNGTLLLVQRSRLHPEQESKKCELKTGSLAGQPLIILDAWMVSWEVLLGHRTVEERYKAAGQLVISTSALTSESSLTSISLGTIAS